VAIAPHDFGGTFAPVPVAQVRDWTPGALPGLPDPARADRFAQFALAAMAEALAQAGLSEAQPLGPRAAVILGTAAGGHSTAEAAYRDVFAGQRTRLHPLVVPRVMHSSAAALLSIATGAQGPVFAVASACAASNHAMGLALQLIRAGVVDIALTGGAEAMLSFGGLKAWEGLRILSPDGCRPFCATRNGMVLGEGAGVFVFEERDRARARGADLLAEVAGAAMGADAVDLLAPDAHGAAAAMQAALDDAGLPPDAIGYVNAHGTATRLNDRTEAAALARVFGDHLARLPVSSTKSMHGHAIGAAGGIELVACLMALNRGIVPPTAGFVRPDPDCPLDPVPRVARKANVQAAMSNAFAFGGLNAVLVLTRA
jgi:nodulation protein E